MQFLGETLNNMANKKLKELLGKNPVIYIDDQIQGAHYIDWRTLQAFQGNFKELTDINCEKMLQSMVTKGFFDIKKVWLKVDNLNPENDIIYIADGHQTIATLTKYKPEIESGQIKILRKSDNQPTHLIPCIFINAENEQDLAEKLLLINSEFGTVTSDGLLEFSQKYAIQDIFMQNVASFKQWNPVLSNWNIPPTKWELQNPINQPPIVPEEITELPPQEPPQIPPTERTKDLPSGEYVEYPIMFLKADYDFFTALIKRVKIEQLFEKNSDAIIHIARQYDTYVGSL